MTPPKHVYLEVQKIFGKHVYFYRREGKYEYDYDGYVDYTYDDLINWDFNGNHNGSEEIVIPIYKALKKQKEF